MNKIEGTKKKRNNRRVGTLYEQAAGYYLEQNGYELITYNYRWRGGEIDIIAKDGECYVFCEVKYRSDKQAGDPLEAVDGKKQKKLYYCAMNYASQNGLMDAPCRFDVIGVEGTKITHIKNAFAG